jgi:hypothetical protein
MTQLFNDRALRKRHRVGDRNGPVRLLTPPLRLTLALGVLIAASGALWATLARIPITVQGTGVLLPVSTINESLSGTNGTVHWFFDEPVQAWHSTALKFRNDPQQFDNQQMAALARTMLRQTAVLYDKQAKPRASDQTSTKFAESLKRAYRGQQFSAGTLLLWVQSSAQQERLQSALTELKRTLADSRAQSSNIEAKQAILSGELSSRLSYLQKMVALEGRGFVSRESILQEQAQVDNIRSQILGNRNELIRIQNQSNQAYQQLRNELAKLINQELLFASRDVYLSQVIPNDGESVTQGQVLLELSDDDLTDPVVVPLFLSSKEMAQVFPGMRALATPSGYKRSEVGGIQAEVVSMGKLPSIREDVQARVGVRSLADLIMQKEPAPTLAVLALKRAKSSTGRNTGGYLWSSRGDLPYPPTPGDRLDVEVTTRRVAPIELVLPALRRFFGWSPPETPASAPAASQPQRQP